MHILVTGARGQLGTELRTVLESRVPGVTEYIDREELDITDPKAVDGFVRRGDYSHIINCARWEEGRVGKECRARWSPYD